MPGRVGQDVSIGISGHRSVVDRVDIRVVLRGRSTIHGQRPVVDMSDRAGRHVADGQRPLAGAELAPEILGGEGPDEAVQGGASVGGAARGDAVPV